VLLLEVKDLTVFYDESCICKGINLQIQHNEEVCLLGRNGVGKTTLMKSIMRLVLSRKGSLIFDGVDITALAPYEVAKAGIGYVPQGRMIFPNLTVLDNLRLGMTARNDKVKAIPEIVFEYLTRLKERLKQRGGTLSGGEQQMLAIGRALCSAPKLLLLDEPLEGLSAGVAKEVMRILSRLCKETDMAFLIVEQNLDMALAMTTRGYVMEKGCIVARGDVAALESEEIVRSHLKV